MTTTEEVLARLDKKTRERLLAASEVETEFLKTPSIGLNIALGGGFAYGRQSLIWGNKSAGKTSICLQSVGIAQREGKVCAWIDAEKSFDKNWAERLGVDNKSLILERTPSISKVADTGVQLIQAGVDIIVVDSITTMLSSSYMNEGEMKDFEKTGQIGQESKDLGKLQKMWMAENDNTAVILISQQRNKITPTYTQLKPTGGEATIFNSSTVVKLFSTESDAKAIMDDVSVGDRIYKEKVGRPVNWEVEFNKLAPMGLTGKYDFYFRGDNVGIDYVGETVELAEKYGIIKKSGGWYAYEGKSYYLKDLAALLRENPDAQAELVGRISEYL